LGPFSSEVKSGFARAGAVRAHEIVAVTGALEVALRDASVACRFGFDFGPMLFGLIEPVISKVCR
jgi:hypothetical protein